MIISEQDSLLELKEIDNQILELMKKRINNTLKIETDITITKKDKELEEKKYQLELIHNARKIGIRRNIIRKIFRALAQETNFLQKNIKKHS